MFGNKLAKGSAKPQTAHIGANICIKGEIDSPEHVFLAGSLDGDITCDQLTIDETGRVKGKVVAKLAIIDGLLDGDIVVERLQIKSKAVIKGSLTYHSIEVAEGAQIDGNFVQVAEKSKKDNANLPKTEK
jgi:cytoskeletal protein CcmA (bactofilin family)